MTSTPAAEVVLIDDDVFSLKLLSRQLEQIGYDRVTAFERANDALALIQNAPRKFRLVIADLQMPEMDGIEFLRHLSVTGYTGAVLLISGEGQRILQTAEQLANLHGLQVIGCLPKPVTKASLEKTLRDRKLGPIWRPPKMAAPQFAAADLEAAIDESEIVAYYQPKIALADGALVGVEALARWRHPHGGILPASQFINAVEIHGHARLLDKSMLNQVLLQAKCWQDADFDLPIALNVQMESLGTFGFLDELEHATAVSGVDISCLTIELTESQIMASPVISLEILARLRLMGVNLSIDDFGTGHSTLTKLRDIPFSEMKLDRSFVHGAGHEGKAVSQAIVESTVSLAHRLGLRIVAEGVENRADWDYVAEIGCDVAQGFFVAKPMPASELRNWLGLWDTRKSDLRSSDESGP
ncbi:Sensor histidine kinase RcsC [Cupriavidus laharis]|uniref:Sensor histidine kinase RcsC n=1 Tax=Cupriavidus laharis TaxID=151654 RepID=A0ABM8XI99_9BURK|nr:EAL domain-containing response regulator [Cupriavidus laharis]CAG9179903.1 Sensor histidine kinase RcsC [Cupriavidus laharis]